MRHLVVKQTLRGWSVLTCLGLTLAINGCDSLPLGAGGTAERYQCGAALAMPQCQAQAQLGKQITGVNANVSVAEKFSGGDGVISNAIMLQNTEAKKGWIKVGYKKTPQEGLSYFWSAQFPKDGIVEEYGIGAVPAAEIGKSVRIDIHEVLPDEFELTLKGPETDFSTTVKIHLWQPGQGGVALMGQQLSGEKGAVAANASFGSIALYRGDAKRALSDSDVGAIVQQGQEVSGSWLNSAGDKSINKEFGVHCCSK